MKGDCKIQIYKHYKKGIKLTIYLERSIYGVDCLSATPALKSAVWGGLSCSCFDTALGGERWGIQAGAIKTCLQDLLLFISLSLCLPLCSDDLPASLIEEDSHSGYCSRLAQALVGLWTVHQMSILANRRTATLQGHACYSQINKDGWKAGKNKALSGPSAVALESTMTTQVGCPRW